MAKFASEPCKMDEQGRIIIPKEVRTALGLAGKGYIVYEVDGDSVRLRTVKWVAR